MIWVILFSFIVFLFAGAPFIAAVRYQRELGARRLSYKTLAASTGSFDPDELQKRFGPPDDEGHFAVSADFADQCTDNHALGDCLPKSWWFRLLNADATSIACLVAACAGLGLMLDNLSAAWWIAGIAAACQLVRWGTAVCSIGLSTFSEMCEHCDE